MSKLRLLHCIGDEEAFAAEHLPERLAKLGKNLAHHVTGVSAEQWHCVGGNTQPSRVQFEAGFPGLAGKPTPGRLLGLANAIKPYDLVLTYGYGSIDVAMAHTLFGEALGLPPLVHHETVLTGEEKRLSKRRSWYRRIALGRAAGLVVPNERLEEAALVAWQQPLGRVKHFAPGVSLHTVKEAPKPDAVRGVIKREGEKWIGAQLGDAQEIGTYLDLVTALSDLPEAWHLVLLTSGFDTDRLSAQAEAKDVAHRVHLAARPQDLGAVMGLFDIWSSLTDSPDAQRSALAAMAHAKPVLASKGNDIPALLSADNEGVLATGTASRELSNALGALTQDQEHSEKIGHANAEHVRQNHGEEQALDRYRRLYASAMKTEIKP